MDYAGERNPTQTAQTQDLAQFPMGGNTVSAPFMQSDPTTKGVAARWRNIRRLYPIYSAISSSFRIGPGAPYANIGSVTEEQEPGAIEQSEQWMSEMDAHIQPHHLRQIMQQTDVAATEPRLLALVQRHASKSNRSQLDSDKLNFVMTQYLWGCAPPSFRSREISVFDAAEVLEPVLGAAPSEFAPWLKPLQEALEQLRACNSVTELKAGAFVERGRELRSQLGPRYFERSSLLLFAYYNFCLRQAFYRCVTADAARINEGLDQLVRAGGGDTVLRVPNRPNSMSIDEVRQRVREILPQSAGEYGIDESWKELPDLRAAVESAVADRRGFSMRSSEERVSQLGDQLQRLLEQIDNVRSELAGLRQTGFATSTPVAPRPAAEDVLDIGIPLDVATPPAKAEMPPANPAPASSPPAAEAPVSSPSPQPDASDDAAEVAREITKQLNHLRSVLASAKSATGLIPIGNTAIVLTAPEIDAVLKGSDKAADLIRQGIGTRMSLVEKLELAKSGQPQEFGPMSRAASLLQSAVNALLKDGSKRSASDPLSIMSRQLAAVLRAVPRK
jgi:hypothetical protein